ncbi:MAG: DUF1501 domain-containing protein [Candidatus Eisenbacteria bacterium]|nr:DUF1501 domain-containing protein [Candidatus Eisenbacteria bacterium]
MKRRDFLTRTGGLLAGGWAGSSVWWPLTQRALAGQSSVTGNKILVMVVLQGGNDGLNTVVPYNDPLYATKRPVLNLPTAQLLDLDMGTTGLHPSLSPLLPLWNQGRVSIIRDVGYPNMNLSHFRATDIMFSASSSQDVISTGWMARWLEALHPGFPDTLPSAPMALQQGFSAGLVLNGNRGTTGVVVDNPSTFYNLVNNNYTGSFSDELPQTPAGDELNFVRTIDEQSFQYAGVIQSAADLGTNLVTYPNTRIANQLATVARLIDGQMGTPVYLTAQSGYDTHGSQLTTHATLLGEMAAGVAAFVSDLDAMGRAEDVLVMTVSEFGRRPSENGSSGTDHGTSAPWFLIGQGIDGGLIGAPPNLASLDPTGNLYIQADYRSVYGTVLQGWMGTAPSVVEDVLFGSFPWLPFLTQTGVPEAPPVSVTHLFAPTPNPGRGQRSIRFQLGRESGVSLRVFDVSGRNVATLKEGYFPAGSHEVRWNPDGLAMGTYLVSLDAAGERRTTKLLVR